MTDRRKNNLRILMRKYLDRSASEKEREDLLHWVSASRPDEVDGLWDEVWQETGDSATIDELEWESVMAEVADRRKNKKSSVLIVRRIVTWVAAAAVLTGVFFAAKWMLVPESEWIYKTGFGETMKIVLEDGTKVDLNADSKLSWNKDWRKNGTRQVYLEGEAYFDVTHINLSSEDSVRMPFDVQTSDVTIHVMGTAFNAASRRGKTEVLLEEGSIELSLKRIQLIARGKTKDERGSEINISDEEGAAHNNTPDVLRMAPGDWISFSSEEDVLVQKTKGDVEQTLDWKDGTLSYQDVEFQVMLRNLEDIYGKSFEVTDQELSERRVKIGIPYKSWTTVKEMMEWMLKIEVVEIDDTRVRINSGE